MKYRCQFGHTVDSHLCVLHGVYCTPIKEEEPPRPAVPRPSSSSSGGWGGVLGLMFLALVIWLGYIYFTRPDGSSRLVLTAPITITPDAVKRVAHIKVYRLENSGSGKAGRMSWELWVTPLNSASDDTANEVKVGEIALGGELPAESYLDSFESDIPIRRVPYTDQPCHLVLRLRETYKSESYKSIDRVSDAHTVETPFVFAYAQWIRWWERKATWIIAGLCAVPILVGGGWILIRRRSRSTQEKLGEPPEPSA
jgi:hypothetical protein